MITLCTPKQLPKTRQKMW